jgi:hypothetical protein
MAYDDEQVNPRRDLDDIEMPTTYTGEVVQGATLDHVDQEDDDDISPIPQRVGPCTWSARGLDFPKAGDRVLVAFADSGEPWLIEWTPAIPTPLGSGTGDKAYTHTQSTPATVWSISHNLGKNPNITSFDNSGVENIGEVVHLNTNSAMITFAFAFAGVAYCN